METLPQDYYRPVSELNDKELCMSTLTEGSHPKSFVDNKICLLCGLQYYFRPIHCKEHLGVTCEPTDAKTQDKQTDKRELHQDSDCVVVGEVIGSASKMARGSDPFKSTRTREEVNM